MPISEDNVRRPSEVRELYRINWLLGGFLAMLSVWTASYLDFEVFPYVVVASLFIFVGLLHPEWMGRIPSWAWRAMPFLLVGFLAVDLYLFRNPLPALVRLNLLLIVYRTLSFRRKREDLQLLVLCLFLIVIAGVITVPLSFIVQILVFIAAAMWFLFNLTLMEHGREQLHPETVWEGFSWKGLIARTLAIHDRRSLLMAGLTFSSLVVLSIVAFLLIPRVDVNNPIPFFSVMRGGQTGFSESIRLGDVTDIKNNPKVALRVEVGSEAGGPPRALRDPYWRMLVLDDYYRGGFRVSQSVQGTSTRRSKAQMMRRRERFFSGSLHPPVATNEWTFYLEGGVARYLPLLGSFESIQFRDPTTVFFFPSLAVMGLGRVNSGMMVYQVENMETTGEYFDGDFGHYSLEYDWQPEFDFFFDQNFTNYPETTLGLPRREDEQEVLEEIVEGLLDGDEDIGAEEFARRAKEYLQRRDYSMSYTVPHSNRRGRFGFRTSRPRDPLVRWLEEDMEGHCEMFAGAFVLLCRTAGFPARIVTGFRGGSWNSYEDYYMVRYSDAHAWAEVFDGYGRWFRVDPTPDTGSSGPADMIDDADTAIALDSSFAAYLDSLRILWYRRVISFDRQSQFALLDMARQGYGKIDIAARLQAIRETLAAWVRSPWDSRRLMDSLGILLSGFLLFMLVWSIGRRDLLRRFSLFWLPVSGCPVRRKAGHYLKRFNGAGDPQEPQEHDEQDVVMALQRIRYGAERHQTGHRQVFRSARRSIRQRARRRRQMPTRRARSVSHTRTT